MRENDEISSGNADDAETRTATQIASDQGKSAKEAGRLSPAQTLGRYMVLSRIGAGGMGQVYSAYDPQLDRRVALKLLHPAGTSADRERLTREAKALARLSHPNVVTVHEVKEYDGRLLVAMEYVDGETLRDWGRRRAAESEGQRTLPALELLLQAGRGLVAAHDGGLIHRDFKPANVLVGKDKRVRVADFGLAQTFGSASSDTENSQSPTDPSRDDLSRSSETNAAGLERLTRTGRVAGTPAYMAPEQRAGESIDHRADQYAFCVTAWEVLFGHRPLGESDLPLGGTPDITPRRLQAILRKGLSERPARRHASMAVLLESLQSEADLLRSDGKARSRRTALWLATLAAAVGGWVAVDYLYESRLKMKCDARASAVDTVWNDVSRASLREGMISSGASYAASAADNVIPWLDRQAESWREHSIRACVNATISKSWEAEQREKAEWCLEDRLAEFTSTVAELSQPNKSSIEQAVQASATLTPAQVCTADATLPTMPRPPRNGLREDVRSVRDQISRASILGTLGEYEQGLAVIHRAQAQAASADWLPLATEVRAREARLLRRTGDYKEAEGAGVEAYMAAVRSGRWDIAAEAATELVWVVGFELARPSEAKLWAQHAAVAIMHAGDPLGLREATRSMNLGMVYMHADQFAEAKVALGESIQALEEALGSEHPSTARAIGSMGGLYIRTGDYGAARSTLQEALALTKKTLGDQHPDVAKVLSNLGTTARRAGDFQRAIQLYEQAIDIKVRALGSEHPGVATTMVNLGTAHGNLGQYERERELYNKALAVREKVLGPDHPETAKILRNLGQSFVDQGEYDRAEPLLQRALLINEKTLGSEHTRLAGPLVQLGLLDARRGQQEEAHNRLARALKIRKESLGPDHPLVAHVLQDIGGVQVMYGENSEALKTFRRAVSILEASVEPNHASLLENIGNLGSVQLTLGNYDEAIRHLERAKSGLVASVGAQHLDVASIRSPLGRAYAKAGDCQRGIEEMEGALKIRRSQKVDSTLVAETQFGLAKILWDCPPQEGRDRARAVALAKEARFAFSGNDQADGSWGDKVEAWLEEHVD